MGWSQSHYAILQYSTIHIIYIQYMLYVQKLAHIHQLQNLVSREPIWTNRQTGHTGLQVLFQKWQTDINYPTNSVLIYSVWCILIYSVWCILIYSVWCILIYLAQRYLAQCNTWSIQAPVPRLGNTEVMLHTW